MFYEEEEGASKADGIVGESRYHEEEEGASKDDGISAHNIYGEDDSGVAPEPGITEQSLYYDEEEGTAKDDGTIAHSIYGEDDSGVAPEEGIIGQSRYYEEQEHAPKDDGITAQSRYHEEEEGVSAGNDVLAHEIYGEDDSGRAQEEAVSEPRIFPDEKVAQAEPSKAVTVLPMTVTVEANPLFDFDRSAIRADSRKELDDLVRELKGVAYGSIEAVGFADPIGAAMYNQKLSEQRAASVKAYLISRGIPADKIQMEGRGSTEEFASYQACGGLRTAKAISCLQPNRRVEVTVNPQKSSYRDSEKRANTASK